MFSKTIFVVAFAAVAQFVAAAQPPACLLGAVNQYESPADIKSVCKSKDASSKIAKFCGSNTEDALSAFADICNEAGVEVSTKVPTTATGSASPSGTGNATRSGGATANPTGGATATGGNAGGNDATATGTGAPAESTGSAGKLEIGAAALIAGLMAAAL